MSKFIKPEPIEGESLEDYGKRVIQANCKHRKGFVTNLEDTSRCSECGKPWMECIKDISESG